MKISVSVSLIKDEELADKIKAIFKEKYLDQDIKWEMDMYGLNGKVESSDSDLTAVFERIVAEYPKLSVYGDYSYTIREDDHSADWWTSVSIRSEKVDGVIKIVEKSSTGWN